MDCNRPQCQAAGIDLLPVKVVRFSGKALTQGVTNLKIDGVPGRVYSPMKTVADCFKYRDKDRNGNRSGGASIIQHSPGDVKPLPPAPLCANLPRRKADSRLSAWVTKTPSDSQSAGNKRTATCEWPRHAKSNLHLGGCGTRQS